MLNFTSYTEDSHLTSLSPSSAEDSFCKTALSRREDIVSCIDVTIMDRSAPSAPPSPYSKIFPAFGAGAAVTHAEYGKMQGAVAARDPFEKWSEIESRQKPPLALEHFDRQFVAMIEHCVDLAHQAAKPRRVLVLHSQARDPNSGSSRAGRPYSIPKGHPIKAWQTSRTAYQATHAARRVPPSLAGLEASVSRRGIG
jgi:hypothetical protein